MAILKQGTIDTLDTPIIIYKVPLYQLGNVTNIFIRNDSDTIIATVDVAFVRQYDPDNLNQKIVTKQIGPKKTLEIEAEFENELLLEQLDRIKIITNALVYSTVIGTQTRKVQAML